MWLVATTEYGAEMFGQGTSRAELDMRLSPAATVTLPPLRQRQMDMERLLNSMVERVVSLPSFQELLTEYTEHARLGTLRDRGGAAVRPLFWGEALPEPAKGVLLMLFPERTMRQLRNHRWPGNLREFAMTVENALTLSLAEAVEAGIEPGGDESRADVIQVRPKLVRDLLMATSLAEEDTNNTPAVEVRLHVQSALNKVAQDVERQYFTALYLQHQGDFAAMASILLGNAEDARKVQLRFNQLGLKVRDLKAQLS